jgi:hypothetical protein
MKQRIENMATGYDRSLTQSLAQFACHFGGAHDINRDRRYVFGGPEDFCLVNRCWQPIPSNHLRGTLTSRTSRLYHRGINLAAC